MYPLPPSFSPTLMGLSLFKPRILAICYRSPSLLLSSVVSLLHGGGSELSRLEDFQDHFCLN